MKKIFSIAGIIAMTAIVSASAFAVNNEPNKLTNPMDQQAFYDSTATLRASLAADQAELNALMVGSTPDVAKTRSLSENISKSRDELRRLSGDYTASMLGHGEGHRGSQIAMNGYGLQGQDPHMNGGTAGHRGGCMYNNTDGY